MSSTIAIAAGVGALGVGWLAFAWARPSLGRELGKAIKTRDLSGLVAFIGTRDGEARETAFNTATRSLWDRYERELATDLIREVGSTIHSANIAQYWIKQALEVEPDIANERLDPEWLGLFYNAEHAARCGKFG